MSLHRPLVSESLSIIPNDWKLEVPAPEAVDQQNDPTDKSNDVYQVTEQSSYRGQEENIESSCEAEKNVQYGQAAKEQDRLHGMKAHKAILFLQEEENEPGDPA